MVLESNTLDVLFVKDGQQGEDGKVLYTWFKYAKDANGTGMSDNPDGCEYIGISYNNESAVESDDPKQYTWSKIRGADGKKGEDAYTIFLENENISFATDESRNPLSEQAYTSGITVMKGATPVTDFTIGDIEKTQGIAVAKTDTAIAISVVNGNPLPSDSGEIEIPITVGGTVFKKILSWTCAKKGEQGKQGIQGPQGEQGEQGPQGEQGEKGKDGTSVTISNKSITYQLSTSGTVIPTGTWQPNPQTIPEGQYQWTKTSVTYSDGNKTESYSISYHGKNGSDGTSVKTTSTSVKYQVGDSGTTKPTGTWLDSVPTVAQGKFLWTQTIVKYSDGNSTESYSVSYRGIDGSNGSNGMNVATVYLYQRATSTPSKPSNALTYTFSTTRVTGTLSNGWSTEFPDGTDPVYVTVASVSSKNDTASIASSYWSAPVVLAQNGKTGGDGKAGLNVATVYLYQRSTSKPSKPSASVTYTFSTGVASGINNGWSQKIPDGTDPLYVTLATASATTATDTILSSEWSDVVVMAQNGEDGEKFSWNLLQDSSFPIGTKKWNLASGFSVDTENKYNGYNSIKITNQSSTRLDVPPIYFADYNTGEDLYLTFWIMCPDVSKITTNNVDAWIGFRQGHDYKPVAAINKQITKADFEAAGNGNWLKISISGNHTVETATTCTFMLQTNNSSATFYVACPMLSRSNVEVPYAPHPSDLEGRGVTETVQYYLATSQSSGVTSSTSGWSTDITTQKITADKKYLWNCYQTKYSDGTSEPISTPKIIGVYGDKGQKGDTGADGEDGASFHWNLLSRTDVSYDYSYPSSNYIDRCTWTTPKLNGDTYTMSFDAKSTVAGDKIRVHFYNPSNIQSIVGSQGQKSTATDGLCDFTLSTKLERYWVTYKIPANGNASRNIILARIGAQGNPQGVPSGTGTITIGHPKVEEGDKPSPWCTTYEETLAKNISITPSAQYFKSTDGGKTFAPNQITITPTLQGEISFGKWQYSIDGGVSFTDVVNSQKGLTISNNVLTVSKDSSLFTDAITMVTFRAVANDSSFYDTCSIAKFYDTSDIGDGRNLLWNSNFADTSEAVKQNSFNKWGLSFRGTTYTLTIDTSVVHNKFNTLKVIGTSAGGDNNDLVWLAKGISTNEVKFSESNIKYTLSFYAKASVECIYYPRWGSGPYYHSKNAQISTEWKYFTINMPETSTEFTNVIISKFNKASTVWFSEFKLEKGSSATGYSTAPEDLQTAILSTKSEISDVSLKVDKNAQAIEQRVTKTTYEDDLTVVRGNIDKANEGLNKWRYEIYPKSLFDSKYQNSFDVSIFAKNKNIVPSQSLLLDDASISTSMDLGDQHIAYGLTFVKFSTATKYDGNFFNDDNASLYVNGKLIISTNTNYTTGNPVSFTFVKGWNCIEVVINEVSGNEGFKFSKVISQLSECQLMNCYYGTPVARESHITNQLVENITNIEGITTTMQKVMTTVGGSDKIDEFVNNYNQTVENEKQFKKTIGETYTTKDEFNGLEIGGRNLIQGSKTITSDYTYNTGGIRTDVGYNGCYSTATTSAWNGSYIHVKDIVDRNNLQTGDKVTMSIWVSTNSTTEVTTPALYLYRCNGNDQTAAFGQIKLISGKWVRLSKSYTLGDLSTLMNTGRFESSVATTYQILWSAPKFEKGTKPTDYTVAPEDDEINGQNLVSNLPSNWEQGTVAEGSATGTTYTNTKNATSTAIRPKDLIPVSGDITISIAYANQSKKPVRHWIAAYDVNKNYLGNNYVSNAWNGFPRTLDMKDAKYIALMIGYADSSAITPSDISKICLKIERGTSATPFTLAPEDVNGKIVNVETIANQTATKFEWIVKGESTSSNLVLTDNALTAIANNINLKGKVTFESLTTDAKNEIDKVAQSKVDNLNIGGRNLARDTSNEYTTPYTYFTGSANTCFYNKRVYLDGLKAGDTITIHMYVKYDDIVAVDGQTSELRLQGSGNVTLWTNGYLLSSWKSVSGSGVYELLYPKTLNENDVKNQYWECNIRTDDIQSGSIQVKKFKVEKGNKATDWTPAPEDYLPQASLVSNWTTNTTWINGGKIYTGSITADKIATDAIKSRNYISSGGTQGSFLNLSDGSFKSPNLSWDANGNLVAKNANLSGIITATTGKIGDFNLKQSLYLKNNIPFEIGSHNAKTVYGKTNDGEIYIGAQGIYNYTWNTDKTYIGDSGSIQANVTDSRGVCITDGTIKVYYSTYCKDYPTAYNTTASTIIGAGSIAFVKYNEDGVVNEMGTILKSNSITTPYLEVVGEIHTKSGSNQIQLNTGNNGSIELYGNTPFIDFHNGCSSADYTVRLIADNDNRLCMVGNFRVQGAFVSEGDIYSNCWIYNGGGAHYTWQGQTDAYLSCGYWSGGNNIYYYANYHAFYVNGDAGEGMFYVTTNGCSSRKGFANTSDERIKQNFSHFDDNFIDTYMNLEPVKYQFKNDTNNKYHFGFKAQQTEKVLNNYGESYNEEYGLCATREIDPEKAEKLYGVKDMHEEYTLAYDELIAPTTYMVQHTYKELERIKKEKADLETRLAAIEAKLGL